MSLRKPVRFRILDLDISVAETIPIIINGGQEFSSTYRDCREDTVGAYVSTYESLTKFDKIKQLRDTLNTAVIGHEAEKLKLIRNISRGCPSDPNRPIIVGIRGPKGVGRGRLIEAIVRWILSYVWIYATVEYLAI
jgi:hypothetical protein